MLRKVSKGMAATARHDRTECSEVFAILQSMRGKGPAKLFIITQLGLQAAGGEDDAEHIHCQCMSKYPGGAPFNIYTCIIIFMRVCIIKGDINMFLVIRKPCLLW